MPRPTLVAKLTTANRRRMDRLHALLQEDIPISRALQGMPTKDLEQRTLEYMYQQSPRATIPFYPNEIRFSEGWRLKRTAGGRELLFTIWHLLQTKGGSKGQVKFRSIEYGHATSQWRQNRPHTIGYTDNRRPKGDGRTYFIPSGAFWLHRGRKGAHVLDKTRKFVRKEIAPETGRRTRDWLRRRIDNAFSRLF